MKKVGDMVRRKRWSKMAVASLSAIVIAGLGISDVHAFDPGWSSGSIQTGGSEYNGPVQAPVVAGDSSNNNYSGNNTYVPVIGGGGAGSTGGYQYYPSVAPNYGSNYFPNTSNQNQGEVNTPNAGTNAGANGGQKLAPKVTPPVASSSSSMKTSSSKPAPKVAPKRYSKGDLTKFAKKQYKQSKKALKGLNQQRVDTNNQKGALELLKAYRLDLKKIKSGKISKQERASYITQQKMALQQALNERLGTLQRDYDQGQHQVSTEIKQLPDGHQYDKQAMALDGALKNLDYQLGHKSDLAYTRYNRAVNQLLVQTDNVKTSEKAQQKLKAKKSYQDNLNAVEAEDPNQLKRENHQRVSDLKDAYHEVLDGIDSGEYTTPKQIQKKLSVN